MRSKGSENNGSVTAVAHYDDCDVALHYTKGSAMSSCLFGKESNYYREVDISMIYRYEVKYFIDMLRTGIMPPELLKPWFSRCISSMGVLESLKTGRPVEFQYRE